MDLLQRELESLLEESLVNRFGARVQFPGHAVSGESRASA